MGTNLGDSGSSPSLLACLMRESSSPQSTLETSTNESSSTWESFEWSRPLTPTLFRRASINAKVCGSTASLWYQWPSYVEHSSCQRDTDEFKKTEILFSPDHASVKVVLEALVLINVLVPVRYSINCGPRKIWEVVHQHSSHLRCHWRDRVIVRTTCCTSGLHI
jgi:hypothetical protein